MSDTVHSITDSAQMSLVREHLLSADVIGLDTESDSMHCYFEKVCFVQIRAGSQVFLIDTLAVKDLELIADILADPRSTMILHGADYDVVCMQRDFGVRFGGLFDTMIAAQYLAKPGLGLAALCQEYFDVELDKTLTRHNWGRRPLEDKYIRYLVEDVAHLASLHQILSSELQAADRLDEAQNEFQRISDLVWKRRDFDPEGFHRIRESRSLDTSQRCILKSVYGARDAICRELDLPPFKVLNNQVMVSMAKNPPTSKAGVRKMWRGPRRLKDSHLDLVIQAVEKAQAGQIILDKPRPRNRRRPASDQRLEQALKSWRQEAAEARDCPTMVVLPNHALQNILDAHPTTREELAATPYLGRRRQERYGDAIIDLVAGESG